LKGVGDITYLGQRDYSMRIWLDPEKDGDPQPDRFGRRECHRTAEYAGGRRPTRPAPVASGQVFQLTMSHHGPLTDVEQFGDMISQDRRARRIVRLTDVANIELGAQAYDQACTLNGQPSVALSVYQLPGTKRAGDGQEGTGQDGGDEKPLPDGVDYAIVYDTTPFINQSIHEVFKTLRDAVILVAVVVLLFLQNWRSAVIPWWRYPWRSSAPSPSWPRWGSPSIT